MGVRSILTYTLFLSTLYSTEHNLNFFLNSQSLTVTRSDGNYSLPHTFLSHFSIILFPTQVGNSHDEFTAPDSRIDTFVISQWLALVSQLKLLHSDIQSGLYMKDRYNRKGYPWGGVANLF